MWSTRMLLTRFHHKSRCDRDVCASEQVLCGVYFCFEEGRYDVEVYKVSTLCKYDLRKGDLFVRRVCLGCV